VFSHNFTLNEAAKEIGRSKGTISKALNNGKLSYISKKIFSSETSWPNKPILGRKHL
jgi:DNA transposition AAA+ family ATPase